MTYCKPGYIWGVKFCNFCVKKKSINFMFGLYLWRKRINQNNKICYEQIMAIILHLPKIPTPTQVCSGLQSTVVLQFMYSIYAWIRLVCPWSQSHQSKYRQRSGTDWNHPGLVSGPSSHWHLASRWNRTVRCRPGGRGLDSQGESSFYEWEGEK